MIKLKLKHKRTCYALKDSVELGLHVIGEDLSGVRGTLSCRSFRSLLLGRDTRDVHLRNKASFLLSALDIALHLGSGSCCLTDSRCNLTQWLLTHITCTKEALTGCFLMLVGDQIAVIISLSQFFYQVSLRRIAREDKDANGISIFWSKGGLLARLEILVRNRPECGISGNGFNLRVIENRNIWIGASSFRRRRGAGKRLLTYKNGNVLCILGQKHAFLCSRKASTDYKDFFAGEELAIASGAVSNTVALIVLFSHKADMTWMCSCGEKNGEAGTLTFGGVNYLNISRHVQVSNFCQQKLCTKGLSLLTHGFRKLRTTGRENSRVINDLISNSDLSAKMVLLDN